MLAKAVSLKGSGLLTKEIFSYLHKVKVQDLALVELQRKLHQE